MAGGNVGRAAPAGGLPGWGNVANEQPEVSACVPRRHGVIQPNGRYYAVQHGDLPLARRPAGGRSWEAINAASTKPFGFMPFTPGPEIGDRSMPLDPSHQSWRVQRILGRSFRSVELANDINSHMPDYVVRRLLPALNKRGRLPGRSVRCWSRSNESSRIGSETPSAGRTPRSAAHGDHTGRWERE
jgi:hypothetical protein